jgi:hypothetical protein
MAKTYQEKLDRKSNKRVDALNNRNAGVYTSLCNELGINDIEDMDLYEQGQIELSSKRKGASKLEGLAMIQSDNPDNEDKGRDYWKGIAEVILPRFQQGRTAANIKYRLREIRKLGFPLKRGIGNMKKEELIKYYNEIRPEIYGQANESCPEVVSRINSWNRQRREEAEKRWMRH